MTKPTNEERREVAERLRNLDAYEIRYAEQFYEELNDTVMNSWDFHSFQGLADRLADLIETAPERTCRMEYDHVHCDYVCTACGEWHNTGMYDACDADDRVLLRPYRYCPKCGARVEVER